MNCPHMTSMVCSWCEAAIEMHNVIVADDIDLLGHTEEWVELVQKSASKYRTLLSAYSGVSVDVSGRIVPSGEG